LKRHACHGQRSHHEPLADYRGWPRFDPARPCSALEAGTGAKAIDTAFDARPDLARRLN
jgi:hypothetical protein